MVSGRSFSPAAPLVWVKWRPAAAVMSAKGMDGSVAAATDCDDVCGSCVWRERWARQKVTAAARTATKVTPAMIQRDRRAPPAAPGCGAAGGCFPDLVRGFCDGTVAGTVAQ